MAQTHAQTETAVANEALSALKLPAITDIVSDTSQPAKVLRKHFAATRDAMQRQYPFNFCEREAEIAPDPDAAKSFRFNYSYVLPTDCLKARILWGHHERTWKVAGRWIVTDNGPTIKLVYTALVKDVAQWDALFRKAFALALAVACIELCQDEETIQEVKSQAREALTVARPADASEGDADDVPRVDVLAIRDSF